MKRIDEFQSMNSVLSKNQIKQNKFMYTQINVGSFKHLQYLTDVNDTYVNSAIDNYHWGSIPLFV